MNFASAVSPGGGVQYGCSAQEESLCRCSTLYLALNRRFLWDAYYSPNRAAKDVLHTDDGIFSPNVVVIKSDESVPQRLDPRDRFAVDVITCAAPDLRQTPHSRYNPDVFLTPEELTALHEKRAQRILHVAAANGADVLILGAFGCGAFQNDPWAVAQAYRNVLPAWRKHFKQIEFAVYCRGDETVNYKAFADTLCFD